MSGAEEVIIVCLEAIYRSNVHINNEVSQVGAIQILSMSWMFWNITLKTQFCAVTQGCGVSTLNWNYSGAGGTPPKGCSTEAYDFAHAARTCG